MTPFCYHGILFCLLSGNIEHTDTEHYDNMRKTLDMKLQAAFPIRQTEDHKTTTMERLQQVKAATVIQKHYRSWQLRRRQPIFDSTTLIITDSRDNIKNEKSHIFSAAKLNRTLSNLSLRSLFSRKKSHANSSKEPINSPSPSMLSPNISVHRSESACTIIPHVIQNLFNEDPNHSQLRAFNSTPLTIRTSSPIRKNRRSSKLSSSNVTLRSVDKLSNNSSTTTATRRPSTALAHTNRNNNNVELTECSSTPTLLTKHSSMFDNDQSWNDDDDDDDGGNTIETTLGDTSSLDIELGNNNNNNTSDKKRTLSAKPIQDKTQNCDTETLVDPSIEKCLSSLNKTKTETRTPSITSNNKDSKDDNNPINHSTVQDKSEEYETEDSLMTEKNKNKNKENIISSKEFPNNTNHKENSRNKEASDSTNDIILGKDEEKHLPQIGTPAISKKEEVFEEDTSSSSPPSELTPRSSSTLSSSVHLHSLSSSQTAIQNMPNVKL